MPPSDRLPFTAHVRSGEVLEFVLRLHPHTRSAAQVGEMVEALLGSLTTIVERDGDVSDGDVIQALTLAAAIRLRTARVPGAVAATLMDELVQLALESTDGDRPGDAAH